MFYSNEDEIKYALGIDSWRNLSKDKVTQFISMMPDMDKEVRLKVIEQFPDFKKFATDALDQIGQAHKSTIEANNQSGDKLHQSLAATREIFNAQLNKPDLNQDERMFILEQLVELVKLELEQDRENKKFLDSLFGKLASGTIFIVGTGILALGGKMALGKRG